MGNDGLICANGRNTSQVVCRELGYSGVQSMTSRSAFTGDKARFNKIRKKFYCTGNEEKLEDCDYGPDDCEFGPDDSRSYFLGVVCATGELNIIYLWMYF